MNLKGILELVGDGVTHLGVKNLGEKSEVWDILSKSAFMMVIDQGFRPSRGKGPRKNGGLLTAWEEHSEKQWDVQEC